MLPNGSMYWIGLSVRPPRSLIVPAEVRDDAVRELVQHDRHDPPDEDGPRQRRTEINGTKNHARKGRSKPAKGKTFTASPYTPVSELKAKTRIPPVLLDPATLLSFQEA